MWRSKKVIIISALLAAILVIGTIGGIALAQTGGSGTTSDNKTPGNALFARVATILGVDQQKLEGAFAQAQRELRAEALDNQLKAMVEQGKITQAQADQYKNWWQSKPDLPIGPGFRGHSGFRGGPGGFHGWGGPRMLPNK